MSLRGRIVSAIAVGVLVFAGFAGYAVHQRLNPTVEATVTWVDPVKRQACIEFINPMDGYMVEMLGAVQEGCPILATDGSEIAIEEIDPGTRVTVKGSWDKKAKLLRARKIQVLKQADPEDWPAALTRSKGQASPGS